MIRHGLSHIPEYTAWKSMKARCRDKNNPVYRKFYINRGIKVCGRWQSSFTNFYNDMGSRPTSQHSLDRVDNNGDYSPENCRWATRREQGLNRSLQSNNKSGHKRIMQDKRTGRWRVEKSLNGRNTTLGYFVDLEGAIRARDSSPC